MQKIVLSCLVLAVLTPFCTNPDQSESLSPSFAQDTSLVRRLLDSLSESTQYGLSYVPVENFVDSANVEHILSLDLSRLNFDAFPTVVCSLPAIVHITLPCNNQYAVPPGPLNRKPRYVHLEFYDGTPHDTTDAGFWLDSILPVVNGRQVVSAPNHDTSFERAFVGDRDQVLLPRMVRTPRPQSGAIPFIVEYCFTPYQWQFSDGSSLASIDEIQTIGFQIAVAGNCRAFMSTDLQTPTRLDSIWNPERQVLEYADRNKSVGYIYDTGTKVSLSFPYSMTGTYSAPTYFGEWVFSQRTSVEMSAKTFEQGVTQKISSGNFPDDALCGYVHHSVNYRAPQRIQTSPYFWSRYCN